MRNHGRWSMTRSSMSSLPSSARIDSEADVKALVIEAIENRVSPSTFPGFPTSRSPQPPANTSSPSLTTATAMPGTLKASRTDSTCASRPASAGGSFAPTRGAAESSSRETAATSGFDMSEYPDGLGASIECGRPRAKRAQARGLP